MLRDVFDNLCELSCDEKIVSHLNLKQRKQYGLLILNLVQQGQVVPKSCSAFNQNIETLKDRLLHIVQYKKSGKGVCGIYTVLICFICVAGCTLPAVTEGPNPIKSDNAVQTTNIKEKEETMEESVYQAQLDGIKAYKAMQKPIETFSWLKNANDNSLTLTINGEKFEFEVLKNEGVLCSDI